MSKITNTSFKSIHTHGGNSEYGGRVGTTDGETIVFFPEDHKGQAVIVTKAGVFRVNSEGALVPSKLRHSGDSRDDFEYGYVKFVIEHWERSPSRAPWRGIAAYELRHLLDAEGAETLRRNEELFAESAARDVRARAEKVADLVESCAKPQG